MSKREGDLPGGAQLTEKREQQPNDPKNWSPMKQSTSLPEEIPLHQ
jgi:hypothetical protein